MRIACVQANVQFGDPQANAARAVEKLKELRQQGVEIAVFPEAFLTGYCVSSSDAARSISIGQDSSVLASLQHACDEIDIMAVFGFAESTAEGLFNGAVLFEPGQSPNYYRKTHLPILGLDRFVSAGTDLPVFETRVGKIGILICYDLRPPEAARVLALAGADLIILPTNWPVGAEISAQHISISRAAENRVFVATCNRVGEENGFKFIGLSKIIDVAGNVLAAAGDGEETIVADIDLSQARQKKAVMIPGEYEVDVIGCRNPALYGSLNF